MKNLIWKKVTPIPPEMGVYGYLYECRKCGQAITSYTEPWILCPNCAGMKLEESYPPTEPTEYEKKRTNADRIRAMSDEELAELWWERVDCGECPVHRECKMTGKDCKRLALEWLRQEATDG